MKPAETPKRTHTLTDNRDTYQQYYKVTHRHNNYSSFSNHPSQFYAVITFFPPFTHTSHFSIITVLFPSHFYAVIT